MDAYYAEKVKLDEELGYLKVYLSADVEKLEAENEELKAKLAKKQSALDDWDEHMDAY